MVMERLEALWRQLDDVQDDVKEIRQMMTGMQVADAQARGDLKVVVGKLDNAADSLAKAALVFHKAELAPPAPKIGGADRWLIRIAAGALVIALFALGGKEVVLKVFGL